MNHLYARHCAKGFFYTISFNSHNRKIRKGKASQKSQGQAANRWWNWDLSRGLSGSNAFAVFIELVAPVSCLTLTMQKTIFIHSFILEKEEGRNIDLWFQSSMHALVDLCMC